MIVRILSKLFILIGIGQIKNSYKYAFTLINLLPLIGVLFMGWHVGEVLVVYLLEILIHLSSCFILAYFKMRHEKPRKGRSAFKIVFDQIFMVCLFAGIFMYMPVNFFLALKKFYKVADVIVLEAALIFIFIYTIWLFNIKTRKDVNTISLIGRGISQTFAAVGIILLGYISSKFLQDARIALIPMIGFKMVSDYRFLKITSKRYNKQTKIRQSFLSEITS